jgi:epoxyqueuosine reductase
LGRRLSKRIPAAAAITPPRLTAQRVKEKARELGFDLCGIAPVDSHLELAFLREWLDRGYAGEMAYMAASADHRADARNLVSGAQSVIVTGTLYNTRSESADADPAPREARIARYAVGDDYHDVLRARLNALVDWMHAESPAPFEARAFVDSGPVQERVYAQYAGLGWIGKNTCLINPEIGSWLFLGEIICTLPLEPDTQGLDGCGSCRKCLDACPTGALVGEHVLDATKCISYLTIELRGTIPEPLRPAIGAHVYGCDICQEVCPYNEAPLTSRDTAWQSRTALERPALADLWLRSDDEWRELLKGSAMRRAKLTGLRRNLAVAIGNSKDADGIASLCVPSDERPSADDEMVREHVEWAIDRSRRDA